MMVNDDCSGDAGDQALLQSEELYRQLFDAASDALFLIAPDTGMILETNAMASELYGYTPEEFRVRKSMDMSAEPEETRRLTREAGENPGEILRVPRRFHRRKDGTIFPVDISARSFTWKDQPVLLVACRNITERVQMENALREKEERLREVLGYSLDASYKRDLQTNAYDYLSPTFTRISGYTPEEMMALPMDAVLKLMHPDDLPEVMRIITESMTDLIGTAYHLEYRFQHKEGRYRWFQDRFTISRNAEGLPLARIGSVRDITEQKTAEMALRESEANVLALFNTTEESIFLLAADETLLALNDVAAQRMGHSRESLIGCRALEMVPSDVVARRRPFIDLALTTGRHVSFEDERNGRWMVNHLHPICDSDGRVVRLAVYSRDITERKQMEDALHKALDDIRTLRGILPICMGCKRIRDDQGYWNEVEVYVRDHTEAEFSHGFCPKCLKRLYPEYDTGDGTGGCIS